MTTHHSIRDMLYEPPGPKTKRWIWLFTILALLGLAALLAVAVRQFDESGQFAAKYWDFFGTAPAWRIIGEGLLKTLEAALTGSAIAFALGFILMRGKVRRSRILRAVSTVVIEFTRGVPTLMFIYFFFLFLPKLTGWKLTEFWKITLPCAISACGVVAETMRSGVNAVPKGQTEAALSLGMGRTRLFYRVVFPQAFRYVIPSMIAELVIVLKDTTFASIVSYLDLMQNAKILISNHDALLSVYLVVAVIYILINYILNKVSDRLTLRLRRNSAEGGKA